VRGESLASAILKERKEAADILGLRADHPFRGLVLAPLCNCTHFCDPGKQREPHRCLHLPTGTPAPFTGTPYDAGSEMD
jgi:hypothetical protein